MSVEEFRRNPLGADLSRFADPASDARLYRILDNALALIEDYIGVPLRFAVQYDEAHPVLSANLPVFPQRTPIRAVLNFAVLAWLTGGSRQTWTIPTIPVEAPRWPGQNPAAFGNAFVDRTDNMVVITSYAGALGFPWTSLISAASDVLVTYTSGYDLVGTDANLMTILSDAVQPTPAPTASGIQLQAGNGQNVLLGVPMVVGTQTGVPTAAVGDFVSFATPLATTPIVGDTVSQRDGVRMPAPDWLKALIRTTARHLINLGNATAGGAAGIGQVRFGNISWTMNPQQTQPDLPQPVKDSLDKRFAAGQAELA